MRVLLDACVPRDLLRHLPGHQVRTAQEMGWGDLDNGHQLDAIGESFDVFVTVDRGLPTQQQVDSRAFSVILLRARTNRLSDLISLVPELLRSVENSAPGRLLVVAAI